MALEFPDPALGDLVDRHRIEVVQLLAPAPHRRDEVRFFENGQMYNGVPVKDNVTNDRGCVKGSVMNWRSGVATRAVLYDIAQLKGVEYADPTVPVTRADLEAWEKKSGVKIGPGDIPLLYIGRWKRRAALGPWTGQVAGYYPDTIPWMHERMPAFIGHDFNIDWNPRPGWEGMRNPTRRR